MSADKQNEEWSLLKQFAWGRGTTEQTTFINTPNKNNNNNNADKIQSAGTTATSTTNILQPVDVLPNFTHKLNLVSAAGFPQYSNYTPEFKNLLDYVYISRESLQTIRIAPFPSEAVFSEKQGLPSQVFPSDHIAIAVDVQFV